MRETIFHLVRHGDYELLGHVLGGRTPGHSLNATGRAQAEAIAAELAGRPIAAVVSSPLERTRETAAPIARQFALPLRLIPELNEIDFGRWTGARFESLDEERGWQVFNTFRSFAQIPEGETMLAAQARAVSAIQRLWREHRGREIVVVSHGDVIRAILAHVLGIPLDLFRRIIVAPGSRSVVAFTEEDVEVRSLNAPPSPRRGTADANPARLHPL